MTDIIKLESLQELADYFARASISPSTRRAYETDWHDFWRFCNEHDLDHLPADPDTVILYLTSLADSGASMSTISRRCTSVTAIHSATDHDSPVRTDRVRRVLSGIRKTIGVAPRQSRAISWTDVRRMHSHCDSTLIGIRDAAILMLGWASALRRSELVALNIGDLEIGDRGIILTIRRSKTDQEGDGAKIGIPRASTPYCPVVATERWIERTSRGELSPESPLFTKIGAAGRGRWWWQPAGRLSARMVALIVKRYADLAGFDPDLYSAHSLRRGLATEAAAAGVPERVISRHTRHTSIQVLRGYIEDGTIWHDNPLPTVYGSSSNASSSLDE